MNVGVIEEHLIVFYSPTLMLSYMAGPQATWFVGKEQLEQGVWQDIEGIAQRRGMLALVV